ncbi:MAG TPA: NAD(P)H-hydrate epimerase, partial [Planctomycetota bacterium]|nr:NAD(P)H-hydrate epimerase [Planctomycetota bacterium]
MKDARVLTVAEARAVDRDAVERLGMPTLLLMENAAVAVAAEARRLGDRFVALCGPGDNGGDGLAAARRLGPACAVHLLREPDASRSPDAALQLRILRNAGREIVVGAPPDPERHRGAVWIDALFGTGLTRDLDEDARRWVAIFNAGAGPKLAVDVPSGLDADTGAI